MSQESKTVSSRVYRVQSEGAPVRLVRATQVRTAAAYVALQGLNIRVASQDDLIEGLTSGVPIENARKVAKPAASA